MPYDYEKLYHETPDALGEPNRELVAFFEKSIQDKARILDVDCGQGRDALFLARRGHEVVGVDLSHSGIRDMLAVAEKEGLPIEGFVADITAFEPEGEFDVLLIDRTLHMLDEEARHDVLDRLLDQVAEAGRVLIVDEKSNIEGFRRVLAAHHFDWAEDVAKRGYLFVRRSG